MKLTNRGVLSMNNNFDNSKKTDTFYVSAQNDGVAVIPSDAKKIRIENDNEHLFFRAHGELNNPEAEFIVMDPNKIVIYKDGVSSGVLGGGSHPLYSKAEIKKGLFSRKKKLKEELVVDVVVYNPALTYRGFWGTPNPIPYRDPESQIAVDFKGRGEYEIKIFDTEKFHNSLVGSDMNFDMEKFQDRVKTFILQEIRHEFARVLSELHLGYLDIVLHEKEIADAIQRIVDKNLFTMYGLAVPQFAIEEFFIDDAKRAEIEEEIKKNRDDDKFKKSAKELAAELERLLDENWEREKYLIGLRREDYQKYLEVVKILGLNKPQQEAVNQNPKQFCSRCGAEVGFNDAFCPSCSNPLKPTEMVCPHCGRKVESKGKFCPHCGKEL